PDRRLAELPLVSAAEGHQLLREWNDPAFWPPWDLPDETFGELFAARVRRAPEAVAVVVGRGELRYRELNARANQVAHHLRALGVGPEVPVGIAAERGPEVVVGLVGILKAGGVYLPLDPKLPAERLGFMIADAGASVVLAQEAVASSLPPAARVVYLDGPRAADLDQESSEDPPPAAALDHLAYVIYTSGTTGVPKGVAVSHRQALPIHA
ncbi:MAG: AMP-binding protein, partial [Deltaproteobacteria bacterium]|nr:AMP-binding protein [Deltaproteobacteria bacterium]